MNLKLAATIIIFNRQFNASICHQFKDSMEKAKLNRKSSQILGLLQQRNQILFLLNV
jgi:hypothetical protein